MAATDRLTLCAVRKKCEPSLVSAADLPMTQPSYPDLSQIKGQSSLCHALELAAAGGHHLLMTGPPGVGKTLSASVLAGLLPPLDAKMKEELWLLRDLAGLPPTSYPEFRAPHHSSSVAALIGGTARATPGEISMAHGGVLFLDELTEFPRAVLNQLRQPLESGEICVSRAEHQHRYPARFQLVAAMNPCPCGFAGSDDQHCHCTPDRIWRYRQGVSGPLLDRIDIHLEVMPVSHDKLTDRSQQNERSHEIRERVIKARNIQSERYKEKEGLYHNAMLPSNLIQEYCSIPQAAQLLLRSAMQKLNLSARAHDKILKLSRTIADLAGSESIMVEHIAEAIHFRSLDREGGI